ncbi:hypothetical protein DPMN_114640 [Dreissena polymorpha]|uniref:Uncharacterized protein n=1 Tax=Dreissena polymorpha TaxID=45954 RepID=A0A9D4KL00_DREPO|nr:hypothetical protein DPMN_114640 [Dreissena polymorpha]
MAYCCQFYYTILNLPMKCHLHETNTSMFLSFSCIDFGVSHPILIHFMRKWVCIMGKWVLCHNFMQPVFSKPAQAPAQSGQELCCPLSSQAKFCGLNSRLGNSKLNCADAQVGQLMAAYGMNSHSHDAGYVIYGENA